MTEAMARIGVDYDLEIKYQPENINTVPNASSRRLIVERLIKQKEVLMEMQRIELKVILPEMTVQLMEIRFSHH